MARWRFGSRCCAGATSRAATVVDASVWISALVPEDVHHVPSEQWLRHAAPLEAPTLVLAEIAGAISRRSGISEFGRRALGQILQTPGFRLIPLDAAMGEQAGRIAADYRIREADAIYVAVAHALAVPLATWNREMHERVGGLITVIYP